MYLQCGVLLTLERTHCFIPFYCFVSQKKDLMHHVAHQTIVMQFILELAKQLDRDPRECVGPFFSRFAAALLFSLCCYCFCIFLAYDSLYILNLQPAHSSKGHDYSN